MRRMITIIAISAISMVAACAPQIATEISCVSDRKHIAVAATGSWPLAYETVREAAMKEVRKECPQAVPILEPDTLDVEALLNVLDKSLPMHSYKRAFTCESMCDPE